MLVPLLTLTQLPGRHCDPRSLHAIYHFLFVFFFLNDPPPPGISPLPLPAPLPISRPKPGAAGCGRGVLACRRVVALAYVSGRAGAAFVRGCRAGLSPFDAVRPKASLCCCESWRWRGCASGFMAATVRRKQFSLCCADSSRAKFFSPPGSPLRCG